MNLEESVDKTEDMSKDTEVQTTSGDDESFDKVIVTYNGELWYAKPTPAEPTQVKGGFEYTVKLIRKVPQHG